MASRHHQQRAVFGRHGVDHRCRLHVAGCQRSKSLRRAAVDAIAVKAHGELGPRRLPVQLIDDLPDVATDKGLEEGEHARVATVRFHGWLFVARPLHADYVGADARIILYPVPQVAVLERSANIQAALLCSISRTLERGHLIGVEQVLDHGVTVLAEASRDGFALGGREGFEVGRARAWRRDE